MMQTRSSFLAKQALLTGVMAVILGIAPAFAKDTAPESMGTLPDFPSSNDAPAMALGPTGTSSDALANFGPTSGTVVGNRALQLRDEVLRLRSSVNLNSNQFAVLRSSGAAGAVQYHSTVAAITARLQNGTTKGNPILMRQWDEANSSLDEVTTSLNRLNSLLSAVDSDASVSSYLMESVQAAFQLSGAVDEDHDQLKLLRDEISRLTVQLDYLHTQTTSDIQRQTSYLTTERTNLQALAFAISRGEMLGNSLANRPVIVNEPSTNYMPEYTPQTRAAPIAPVSTGVVGSAAPMSPSEYMSEMSQKGAPAITDAPASVGRLLVLIRYNQPHVEYQQQLSHAVGTALDHHPNADFSIVAVSPASGDPSEIAKTKEAAKRNAEDVKRALIQLGLAPSHIILADTQSQAAQVPEVHVFVR